MKLKKIALYTTMIVLTLSLIVLSHFTWIRIDNGKLQKGKPAELKISHGHKFPLAGSSISTTQTDGFVSIDNKKPKKLKLTKHKGYLSSRYTPEKECNYCFYFIYDPGILSKITRGWKTGGKEKYPKALKRMKQYEASAVYAKTDKSEWKKIKPHSFRLELLPEKIDKEIALQLLMDEKPRANEEVYLTLAGKKSKVIGKTDKRGKFKYKIPAKFKGELLFSVDIKITPENDKEYDIEFIRTTTLIDLR